MRLNEEHGDLADQLPGAKGYCFGNRKLFARAWREYHSRGSKSQAGFYHGSYIKVGDVKYQPSPFPNYLVHLNGQIGQTRQSFYADVLEDGRIVRPVPVSASVARRNPEPKANPQESWGVPTKK